MSLLPEFSPRLYILAVVALFAVIVPLSISERRKEETALARFCGRRLDVARTSTDSLLVLMSKPRWGRSCQGLLEDFPE